MSIVALITKSDTEALSHRDDQKRTGNHRWTPNTLISPFLSAPIRVYLWPFSLCLCASHYSLFQAIRLVTSQRKIFSQRISLPIVRQENATQIRVIIENHSKQIVSFALMPIRCSPDGGDTRCVRVVFI